MQKESYTRLSKQLNFEPRLRALLLHLFVDAGLVVAIFQLNKGSSAAGYLLSQLLLPVLLFRSFALMHECVHSCAGRRKWVNDLSGILAGTFCFLPYEPWKKIHLAHHKWAGNVDRDPSMGLIKGFPGFGKFRVRLLDACWRRWFPALALSQHLIFWSKSYQYALSGKHWSEKTRNFLSVAVPLALYTQVNWLGFLPGIVAYLVMVEVINFPHHLQMPMLQGDDSFSVYDQSKTARSCLYPRWFARHVLNNFNLHIEHHLFPRLPWYRLDEAQILVRAEPDVEYTAVEGNGWIRANRQRAIAEILSPNFSASPTHSSQEAPKAA